MYTLSSLLGIKTSALVHEIQPKPCTGDGCGTCLSIDDAISQLTPEKGKELDRNTQGSLDTLTTMKNIHQTIRKRITGMKDDFDFKRDLWPLSVFKEVDDPIPGKKTEPRPEYQFFRFQFPDKSGHALLIHHKTEGHYQAVAFLTSTKNPSHQQMLATDPTELSTKAVFEVQKLYFRNFGLQHPWFHNES